MVPALILISSTALSKLLVLPAMMLLYEFTVSGAASRQIAPALELSVAYVAVLPTIVLLIMFAVTFL